MGFHGELDAKVVGFRTDKKHMSQTVDHQTTVCIEHVHSSKLGQDNDVVRAVRPIYILKITTLLKDGLPYGQGLGKYRLPSRRPPRLPSLLHPAVHAGTAARPGHTVI